MQTVRTYVEALDRGDPDRANAVLHDDVAAEVEDLEGDFEIEEAELIERNSESATVSVTQTSSTDDAAVTNGGIYRLERVDGAWQIVEIPRLEISFDTNVTDVNSDIEIATARDLELVEHELVRENDGEPIEAVTVVGTVENTGDTEVKAASVALAFLDDSDTVVGETAQLLHAVEPGERREFEARAMAMGEDAAAITDYEISVE